MINELTEDDFRKFNEEMMQFPRKPVVFEAGTKILQARFDIMYNQVVIARLQTILNNAELSNETKMVLMEILNEPKPRLNKDNIKKALRAYDESICELKQTLSKQTVVGNEVTDQQKLQLEALKNLRQALGMKQGEELTMKEIDIIRELL